MAWRSIGQGEIQTRVLRPNGTVTPIQAIASAGGLSPGEVHVDVDPAGDAVYVWRDEVADDVRVRVA